MTFAKYHSGLLSLRMHNAEFEIWQRLSENSKNPMKRLVFEDTFQASQEL